MGIDVLAGRVLKGFEYKEGLFKDDVRFYLHTFNHPEEYLLRYPTFSRNGKVDIFGRLEDIVDSRIVEVRQEGNDFGGVDYTIMTDIGAVTFRFYEVAIFERL